MDNDEIEKRIEGSSSLKDETKSTPQNSEPQVEYTSIDNYQREQQYNEQQNQQQQYQGQQNNNNQGAQQASNPNNKRSVGICCGLFLGLIGLIIGFCCFDKGSEKRDTFINGWAIGFIIDIVLTVIMYVLMYRYISLIPDPASALNAIVNL